MILVGGDSTLLAQDGASHSAIILVSLKHIMRQIIRMNSIELSERYRGLATCE
jgi:hypothetical protein